MPQERTGVRAPLKRVGSFQEIHLGLTRRDLLEGARIFLEREKSVKGQGCVLGTDYFSVLRLMAKKDFAGALEKVLETNPLPGVTGRLCDEPFVDTQVFNRKGERISLRAMECFLADKVRLKMPAPASRLKQKVAVIGSGPAGLTAAWVLSCHGFRVTVVEMNRLSGGSLTFGWPEFSLPFRVVEQSVRLMTERGISFSLNTIFGRNTDLAALKDAGFAAVLLATGAGVPRVLGVPGESAAGVIPAGDFLRAWREARLSKDAFDVFIPIGKKVIVAGSGAAGLHAARIALRRGSDVTVLVSGAESEMNAEPWLVREAVEEGVKIKTFMRPEQIVKDHAGCVKGLVCRPVDYRIDKQGRLNLVADTNEDLTFETDTVIVAAGGGANTLFYRDMPGDIFSPDGSVKVLPDTGITACEGVFAAGAVVAPSMNLLETMASASRAAGDIEKYLNT